MPIASITVDLSKITFHLVALDKQDMTESAAFLLAQVAP